jgi:endonuclease/exonuclease/phosphatase family metal-dependent hydrolase
MGYHRAIWPRASAAVVLAAALTILALGVRVDAAPDRETFLQFNMCGNACNRGALRVVAHLAGSIERARPVAVTLNEVCENQYQWLRSHLAAYRGEFDPTGPICVNGARYGNAVLARTARLSTVGTWPLPSPAGGESRRLLCVHAQPSGTRSLVVCVTHISYVAGNIAAQVGTVAGVVHGLARTGAVLLGGDFNADPADARMDPLYNPCRRAGTGILTEADSAGCASRSTLDGRAGADVVNEDTRQRHKLDYIFLSSGDWATSGAHTGDAAAGLSDHDPLWAEARSVPDVTVQA